MTMYSGLLIWSALEFASYLVLEQHRNGDGTSLFGSSISNLEIENLADTHTILYA